MSVSPRLLHRLAVLLLVGGLAGCGFQPLYGNQKTNDGTALTTKMSAITIAMPTDRRTQLVRNALLQRLQPGDKSAYQLSLEVSETTSDLAIQADSRASRASFRLRVKYNLYALAKGETVLSGTVSATASFNEVESEFANRSAEDDSRRRTANDAADKIIRKLSLYFTRPASTPSNTDETEK